jgi:hypothetical protein
MRYARSVESTPVGAIVIYINKLINENAALYPDPSKDINLLVCFTEAT